MSNIDTVEKTLENQRSNCTLSNLNKVEKLSKFLFEPSEYQQYLKVVDKTQTLKIDFNLFNKGRLGIIKQSFKTLPGTYNNYGFKNKHFVLYSYLASIYQMPGGIHVAMYTFCIELMGTDSQHQKYLKDCYNWDMVGCYAQTQLGHGSDVQSLETVAKYQVETDTFLVDSPTVTAAKYWPGQLGFFCTHALVFAQLEVNGKRHGVHAFIVPIRDKDYNPLPGVEVGDIGPKYGFHSKDNGYLLLHNVQIPKLNMLRRFTSVSKKGQIKTKGDPKVSYATMMSIRQYISCLSPKTYSLGIITASRYSCFRKQFKNSKGIEVPIIQYQTQQNKILTRVAEYYAICLGGNNIRKITDQNFQNVKERNDFSLMNQTHACLCLGKAFYGQLAYDGMEICRKACGGHGYSHYSAIPSIIFEYAANLTMEGQNSILYLQVARYVLKCYKYFMTGKKAVGQSANYINSFDYLTSIKLEEKYAPIKWNLQILRLLLAQAMCSAITRVTLKLMNKPEGMSDSDVTSYMLGMNLHELGKLHAAYYTFNSFKQAIQRETDEELKDIITDLGMIFGIEQVMRFSMWLIDGEYISRNGISELNEIKEKLYVKIRPNLIPLIDGFAIPQKVIYSHLASGNPYQNYLQMARKCEINTKASQSAMYVRNNMQQKLALHAKVENLNKKAKL